MAASYASPLAITLTLLPMFACSQAPGRQQKRRRWAGGRAAGEATGCAAGHEQLQAASAGAGAALQREASWGQRSCWGWATHPSYTLHAPSWGCPWLSVNCSGCEQGS